MRIFKKLQKRQYLVAFDLDTKKLSLVFGEKNYRVVYKLFEKMFKCMNFTHKQGSVYASNDSQSFQKIMTFVSFLTVRFPLIGQAVKQFDIGIYLPKLSLGDSIRKSSAQNLKSRTSTFDTLQNTEEIIALFKEAIAALEVQTTMEDKKGDFTIEEK